MKAILCSAWGGPETLRLGEVASPTCGPGQVRVAVRAAGVNFADVLMIRGSYQVRPPLPFTPGFEGAGEVVEVGNDVGDLEVGDRVAVYSGLGAYAEEVAAPAGSAFKLPTGLPWAEAAGLAVAYGTSYHGLVDRAGLQSGETLLVLGAAGGVGSAAVEIGKALGAKVIAAVSSQTKAEFVLGLGADEVIRYDQEILRDRLKGGVDVVYDPVGGDHTETAFRSLAWGGRHLVVGFSAGAIPRLPVNLALLKGGSLVGVFWGRFVETEPERARANLRRLAQWWDKGLITIPVWRRFPLAEAPTAMDEVEGRRALGKVVLEISG